MSVKEIVISMLTVMTLVFILYRPFRKREQKTNKLEILYFEALKEKAKNIEELGMDYYQAIGLTAEAAKVQIQDDVTA
ncbi:hypothetical protein A9Q84_18780 [Halobacteriovorax marinus]|uniref:Uncharacterized protein n=1 Tax=Halobacteriovorax marinus TaxID=97084 RepID=A0A1Y5F642_9BACT|nr:hypothetical protein A9Q84_18780 [Halobacteriovorax marinus]